MRNGVEDVDKDFVRRFAIQASKVLKKHAVFLEKDLEANA